MQGGDIEAKVYDASLAEKLEGAFLQRLRQQELRGNLPNVEDGVTILGTAVGDTRVCFGWTTSGYTYLDDTEQGIARSIWDVLLSIVSYFVNTAGNIILDVASFLGVTCDRDQGATSRLLHSYRYITKYAQVYEPSLEWKTWYTSRSREWYRHEYASFVNTLGDTETDTIDYTYTRGYSPINTDWAPHYSDHTYLMNKAHELWYSGGSPGYEDWTANPDGPVHVESAGV